jgi:hypothetical protein
MARFIHLKIRFDLPLSLGRIPGEPDLRSRPLRTLQKLFAAICIDLEMEREPTR